MFRREASMSVPPEVRGADTGLQETIYPAQPQNKGTAPFHVLATLFDKLSAERRQERRRKLLEGWFTVRRTLILGVACAQDDATLMNVVV
jgi:hypothetical protein